MPSDLDNVQNCSLCGKSASQISILTEITLSLHSYYHRADNAYETMNGLRKENTEYFCEDCFQLFVEKWTSFCQEQQR